MTAVGGVTLEGVVDSAKIFGRQVYLHRRIAVAPDRAEVNVSDRIANEGTTPAAVPILYHLNFGPRSSCPARRSR
jgi:hypothetical protein